MAVYLDVIWFLNFCTDYLLLTLTGILLKRDIKKKRILISSAIASLYVLIIFTPYAQFFYHPAVKFVFSMFIVFIAFQFKRFSYFFQNVAMFYFVAFMIGGGLIAVRFFLQTDSQLLNAIAEMNVSSFGDPISWLFVIIGFPLLWIFSRNRFTNIEYRTMTYDQIAVVEVHIEDEIFRLKGLIDSGNHLTDPLTKAPVMVMEQSHVSLPFDTERLLSGDLIEESNHPWSPRMRFVPYRSVGQEEQFMLAIRPDFIRIFYKNETYIVKQLVVGLTNQRLSSEGDYNCILHPKMIMQSNTSNAS